MLVPIKFVNDLRIGGRHIDEVVFCPMPALPLETGDRIPMPIDIVAKMNIATEKRHPVFTQNAGFCDRPFKPFGISLFDEAGRAFAILSGGVEAACWSVSQITLQRRGTALDQRVEFRIVIHLKLSAKTHPVDVTPELLADPMRNFSGTHLSQSADVHVVFVNACSILATNPFTSPGSNSNTPSGLVPTLLATTWTPSDTASRTEIESPSRNVGRAKTADCDISARHNSWSRSPARKIRSPNPRLATSSAACSRPSPVPITKHPISGCRSFNRLTASRSTSNPYSARKNIVDVITCECCCIQLSMSGGSTISGVSTGRKAGVIWICSFGIPKSETADAISPLTQTICL